MTTRHMSQWIQKIQKTYVRLGKKRYLLGILIIVVLAIVAAILLWHNNAGKPNNQTSTNPAIQGQSKNTNAEGTKQDTPQAQQQPPRSAPTVPGQSGSTTTQDEVLDTCVYQGGPKDGQQCPKTPPPSYASSAACYYSHPSYLDPTNCRPYETTNTISAWTDTTTGNSYCIYIAGAGQFKSYKKVQVTSTGQPTEAPDCSTANPI